MSARNIRKNDTVIGITGIAAGKTGRVLQVLPVKNRIVVEGLNLVKRTLRKSQDNPQGGIVEKEKTVAASNFALYCSNCKKGSRVSRIKDGDRTVRKCKRCGHMLDS